MKLQLWFAAALVAAFGSFASLATAQTSATPPGAKPLINLEDRSTWRGGATRDPREIAALQGDELKTWNDKMKAGLDAHWRVEKTDSGLEIVSDGHEPFLSTDRDFGDFELWIDWKINPDGDSGIYLRGCPQVQIWDPWSDKSAQHGAAKGSGALWNNEKHERFPPVRADNKPGEWNRMHVTMIGPYVTVELNDKTVVDNVVLENYYDRKIPVFARGPIYLQTHGSETRFRNAFIREIDADEANRRLEEIEDAKLEADDANEESAFTPLFDGKSLAGWIGATDDYEVADVDGTPAIRCKAGRGGTLLADKEFGDFILRFEFKLPPGGNNGLAIRTPSPDADPHLDGIELQILDDTDPKYAELHDYQFHGSAYGLAPAHRGFLRPVGEWNQEQVVVRGDHIEVTVNGYKTLDVNLADVRDKPLDGLAHPGASRTTGHLGFCGHQDPVAFRNIRVKKLDNK